MREAERDTKELIEAVMLGGEAKYVAEEEIKEISREALMCEPTRIPAKIADRLEEYKDGVREALKDALSRLSEPHLSLNNGENHLENVKKVLRELFEDKPREMAAVAFASFYRWRRTTGLGEKTEKRLGEIVELIDDLSPILVSIVRRRHVHDLEARMLILIVDRLLQMKDFDTVLALDIAIRAVEKLRRWKCEDIIFSSRNNWGVQVDEALKDHLKRVYDLPKSRRSSSPRSVVKELDEMLYNLSKRLSRGQEALCVARVIIKIIEEELES